MPQSSTPLIPRLKALLAFAEASAHVTFAEMTLKRRGTGAQNSASTLVNGSLIQVHCQTRDKMRTNFKRTAMLCGGSGSTTTRP